MRAGPEPILACARAARRSLRIALVVAGGLTLWHLAGAGRAQALPAFARTHQLTCGTCHTAAPQLNAYGRAFRDAGFAIPGLGASTPMPDDSPRAAAESRISFWVRGPVFERSDFRSGPDRTRAEVPSDTSLYFWTPLASHSALLVEGALRTPDLESNGRGKFTPSTYLGLERAFVSTRLLSLWRSADEGPAPGGPIVTAGRFDPSTFFSYPTRRQQLHTIPGDTERSTTHSDVHRFPLSPYAMGARFFGLFDRSGEVLLPTTESLFNATGNLGAQVHGTLGRAGPLLAVGFLNGAAPEFPDIGDTLDPYLLLRYDFGSGALAGSVSALGNYGPGTAQVRYTAAEARDGVAGRRTLDWLRTGAAAQLSWRALEIHGAVLYDELFRVPSALRHFDENSAGLTVAADYRLRPTWLASIRYDWMNPGGFDSALAGLDGPRSGQALHFQIRWLHLHGQTRPRSVPGLAALTLRNSVNLSPGGGDNPLRSWENTLVIGIDVSL
jgi:hypothetical protein